MIAFAHSGFFGGRVREDAFDDDDARRSLTDRHAGAAVPATGRTLEHLGFLRREERACSGREISQNGIPTGGATWQNTHLVYTHGYGAVAAQVNTATTEGAPLLTLRDIPPVGEPTIAEPRIYFGELNDVPFVVTNTHTKELDYEGASQEQETTYTGTGGIPIGNIFQRALFAWRYKDINLLISGLIDSNSRIMIYRDLAERVPKPAPFLKFDGDPYLAVVDGRLTWIWDAYTTTSEYPYSESVNLGDATQGSLSGTANYIRNSVKVTVDAYNGDMKYYIWDDSDPIIQAWSKAFPGMFLSKDDASPDLLAHVRYPENLFQVQASQFASYHVTDPAVFFQKQDVWQIPIDPTVAANGPTAGATGDAGAAPMRPYYSLMRLPGATSENFMLILPFTPSGRQNMVSWMAANSDPDSYGNTVVVHVPERPQRRRSDAGVRADQPGPGFLQGSNAAGFGWVDGRVR